MVFFSLLFSKRGLGGRGEVEAKRRFAGRIPKRRLGTTEKSGWRKGEFMSFPAPVGD